MAYAYKGTKFEDDPIVTSGCGTYAGYRAHLRNGEDTCRDCKDAANAYWRENYELRKRRGRKVFEFTPDKGGTNAGYARHYFYKVPACEPCRRAAAQYMADRRAKRSA